MPKKCFGHLDFEDWILFAPLDSKQGQILWEMKR